MNDLYDIEDSIAKIKKYLNNGVENLNDMKAIHQENVESFNESALKMSNLLQDIFNNPKINLGDYTDTDILLLFMAFNEYDKQIIKILERIKRRFENE